MKGIEEKLKRLTRRVRWAKAMRGLAIGALGGALAASGLAALDRFGLYYTSWPAIIACCMVGGALGFVIGFLLRVDRLDLADSVDRRLDLRNCLRTALENSGDGEFDKAVLSDADRRLSEAAGKNAFPLKLTRWHAGAVFGMGLAAMIFLLGNSPIFLNEESKKERAELQAAAKHIQRISKPILEGAKSTDEAEERELAERLERLTQDLEKGRMTKKEALIRANELSEAADRLAKNRYAKAGTMMLDAETALERMQKERLEAAGLGDADLSKANQTREELESQENALNSEIAKLGKELEQDGLSQEERKQLESKLKEAQKALQEVTLSKKAQDFLDRLYAHPEFKKLLEMAQKLKQSAKAGEQGQQELTQEQIDEMIKKLEELADKLKTEEDLKEFIETLKKALGQCKGACAGAGVMPGILKLLGGNGGPSRDNFFSNTGQVPENKEERDIKAKTEEHAARGARAEQGTETHIEIMGPSAHGERTKTPYTKVLPNYRKSAEQAINRQQIPKSQQKRVREYFESLTAGK
ncbi:MAG: hypothetical protein H0W86_01065 [Armatimonadetes bacterium]|nr:hypothetical protein [Armatimonadota bacterium]